MELKTITLSPDMRQRLETAMKSIEIEYRQTKNADLLLEAFSAAIWENPRSGKRTFGLAPLTDAQIKEAGKLGDALVAMANASCSPAVVIENLPENGDCYEMALKGLSLTINSGHATSFDYCNERYVRKDGHSTERANHILPVVRTTKEELTRHAETILHSDSAGIINPQVQMIGGDNLGNNPISTVIATISEVIDETASQIYEKHKEYGSLEEVKSKVIAALKAPIWQEIPLINNISGQDIQITTKAAIYENPNKTSDAPSYGLLRDPRSIVLSNTIKTETLKEYDLDIPFLKILKDNIRGDAKDRNDAEKVRGSLYSLKPKANGLVVKAGQVLVWNENFVVHGTGTFQNTNPITKRTIHLLQTPSGLAQNLGEEQTPGALPLSCAIQSQKPKQSDIRIKTL